ncbi:NACHT domain-containing protein [Streptomyces sp. NBC_00687]|nr:NACHT domain-containing protein [Streptomyces sp. NBC_00687]
MSLLSWPLGVTGVVLAVVALRRPVEGNDAELARGWAATLAAQVETGEGAVWRQLLGDDTRRINLTYVLQPTTVRSASAPAAGRLADDGPGAVTLPDIVTYYRSTRPMRLVVTGAAGAGKTVLALELLLALIDSRKENEPVPVRVPLSRWDTERQSLPDLLQQRLVEAYDWPQELAASLVRQRLVLPVLDGLDEMDPLVNGTPDPAAPRATTVVRALNTYQHGRDAVPLILTCRTRHYDALTASGGIVDAARIAIAPVDTADTRIYLADRALDAAPWQPLLDHLATNPGGHLATVLSTPWRLCLTATVYHHDGEPGELLTLPDADALDQHLLARYIPAAVRTTPNPRSYSAEDVHAWLHHLTTYLDPAGTLPATAPAGAEATDLVLHELWPLAGRTRVRATDVLLSAITPLTALPLVWTVPPWAAGWVAVVISAMATVSGTLALTAGSPSSLVNPLGTAEGRKEVALGIAQAIGGGLVLGYTMILFVDELPFNVSVAVLAGIIPGIAFVSLSEMMQEPGVDLVARAVIKSNALAGIPYGVCAGLTLGLPFGLRDGLTTGLAFGLSSGLMAAPATGARLAWRYVAFLICSRRRLPFRLGLFLDWAATAGLMRYSGPAYQYRHRELQHWLRQHPQPPSTP